MYTNEGTWGGGETNLNMIIIMIINNSWVIFTIIMWLLSYFSPLYLRLKLWQHQLWGVMKGCSALLRWCISVTGLMCSLICGLHRQVYTRSNAQGSRTCCSFIVESMCTSDCTLSIVSRCGLSPLYLSLSLFAFISHWPLPSSSLPHPVCHQLLGATYPIKCLLH